MAYVVYEPQEVNFSSDLHNLAFEGSMFNLTATNPSLSFTGIDPYGRAMPGTEIVLCNIGTNAVTLAHNDAGSTSGNRFWFSDDIDHTLAPKEMVWGIYKEADPSRVGWWIQF